MNVRNNCVTKFNFQVANIAIVHCKSSWMAFHSSTGNSWVSTSSYRYSTFHDNNWILPSTLKHTDKQQDKTPTRACSNFGVFPRFQNGNDFCPAGATVLAEHCVLRTWSASWMSHWWAEKFKELWSNIANKVDWASVVSFQRVSCAASSSHSATSESSQSSSYRCNSFSQSPLSQFTACKLGVVHVNTDLEAALNMAWSKRSQDSLTETDRIGMVRIQLRADKDGRMDGKSNINDKLNYHMILSIFWLFSLNAYTRYADALYAHVRCHDNKTDKVQKLTGCVEAPLNTGNWFIPAALAWATLVLWNSAIATVFSF